MQERCIVSSSNESDLSEAQDFTKVLTVERNANSHRFPVVVVWCSLEVWAHTQNCRFVHVHSHANSELFKRAAQTTAALLLIWHR